MKPLPLYIEFNSHPPPPLWVEIREETHNSAFPQNFLMKGLSVFISGCFQMLGVSAEGLGPLWECSMCAVMMLPLKCQNVLQTPKLNSNSQPSDSSMFPHLVGQSRNLNYSNTIHHQNWSLTPQKCQKFTHFFLTLHQEPISSHLDCYKFLIICSFK